MKRSDTMISFEQACEMAYNHFLETKEQKGICDIIDYGDAWVFWGKDFPIDVPEYGNMPIMIVKENGDAFYFNAYAPDNIEKTINAEKIEIPEKYKMR